MQPLYSRHPDGGIWRVHDRHTGRVVGFVHRAKDNPRQWVAFRRRPTGEIEVIPGRFDSRREATQEVTNP